MWVAINRKNCLLSKIVNLFNKKFFPESKHTNRFIHMIKTHNKT